MCRILNSLTLCFRDKYRVVGFEVETMSVDRSDIKFEGDTCNYPDAPRPQAVINPSTVSVYFKICTNFQFDFQIHPDSSNQLYFTYSVEFKSSSLSWASRWDTYLRMSDVQIHWFSIINSLVVVFFLSGILTMIMVRTLRQDIARYNTDDNYEDTLEETGILW